MIAPRAIAANAVLIAGAAAIVYQLKDVWAPIPMPPGGIGAISFGLLPFVLLEFAPMMILAGVLLRIARRRGAVSSKASRIFWSVVVLMLIANIGGGVWVASSQDAQTLIQDAQMVFAISFSGYVALVTYAGYKAVAPVPTLQRSE